MAALAHRPRSRTRIVIGALLVALVAMPFARIGRAGAVVGDTVSIQTGITQLEGTTNSGPIGTSSFNFAVTLTPGNTNLYGNENVTYTIGGGTATGGASCTTSGVDYINNAGAVNFALNDAQTTKIITVPVCKDALAEATESFVITLASMTPGLIVNGTSTGNISNDDGTPPSISATVDGPITEGNDPNTTTPMTFTVTATGALNGPVSVDWKVQGDTATAGTDFTAPSPDHDTFTFTTANPSFTVVVGVKGDTVDEADEKVLLALSNPNNATIVSGNANTFGVIADDDAGPTVAISGPATVGEADGTATYTVALSAASGQSVTATVAITPGTATAGTDYTANTPQTVSFSAGEQSKTVTVTITNDNFYDPGETYSVGITSATGASPDPAHSTVTTTITDNDAASGFSVADATATEGTAAGTTMTFTVTVAPNPNQQVTVDYATVPDTAEAPADFTSKTGTLTFPLNTTSKTVAIAITPDAVHEPTETFNLVLSNPVGATISDGTGVGTITDNDTAPSFAVTAPASTTEAAGPGNPAVFTVQLSALSEEDANIPYTVGATGDTATAGTDYANVSGTLVIPAGQQQGTISVPITDDALHENNETFTLNLTPGTGTSGTAKTSVATITDNDAAPVVTIKGIEGPEGSGNTTTPFQFEVDLSAPSGVNVTVTAATSPGTATSPSDFASTTGTVTIPAGSPSANFAVNVVGDNTPENNEDFTVTLTNPQNATLGATTTATGTIDDDDGPIPSISIADATAAEGAGTASFTVTMSATTTSDVTFTYNTANGTATAGSDYTAQAAKTAKVLAGQTTATVTVPITQDVINEDNETFTITISNLTPGGLATMGRATATGTITDDDALVSSVTGPSSVTEGGGNATYTIHLTVASAFDVTVAYTTNPGTATSPADYTTETGTIVVPAGQKTVTVDVPIVDDSVNEPTESFSFEIDSATRGTISGAANKVTTSITDNDAAPTFAIANTNGTEGTSSGGTSDMVFTVTKTGATAQTINLSYHTSDGTATAGSDYTAVPTGTVTFLPGDTTKTIVVKVGADNTPENDETFNVVLTAASAGTITTATGVATILDDDAPALSVNSPAAVSEAAGTVTFTVSLAQAAIRTVTVDYTTANGTAQAGSDFTTTSGTLSFAVGETSKTVAVPVLEDALYEANETFNLVLSNPTGSPIGSSTGTATINDNDPAPTASIADASVAEGSAMQFTVTLSTAAGQPITLTYKTTPGTASSSDFVGTSTGSVTFGPGTTSRSVSIPVTQDSTDEPDEAFTVTLSNPSPAAVTFTRAAATGTIVDDDAPAALSISDVSVGEPKTGTSTAVFTVSVAPVSGKDIMVPWSTANGTAGAADYTASSGTLTITAGSTSGTIAVPVKADSLTEPNETFVVNLGTPDNATVADGQAVATIVDAGLRGYWLTASDGGIFNYGDAPFLGSIGGHVLNQPVVGMTVAPDHQNYWQVASDGGVFTYPIGSDRFYGSMGGHPLNKPIVGMAATPTGKGYWLVASDGGVFNFGDAGLFGSLGSIHLNQPIVGMAATKSGQGYWLVASDGGVFNFGDAGLFGSLGSTHLNSPIVGMAPTPSGKGYWMVGRDGGVFNFGDAPLLGSKGGQGIDNIVGLSAADGGGYRLASADGHVYPFGTANVGSPAESTPPVKLFRPIVGTTGF